MTVLSQTLLLFRNKLLLTLLREAGLLLPLLSLLSLVGARLLLIVLVYLLLLR